MIRRMRVFCSPKNFFLYPSAQIRHDILYVNSCFPNSSCHAFELLLSYPFAVTRPHFDSTAKGAFHLHHRRKTFWATRPAGGFLHTAKACIVCGYVRVSRLSLPNNLLTLQILCTNIILYDCKGANSIPLCLFFMYATDFIVRRVKLLMAKGAE